MLPKIGVQVLTKLGVYLPLKDVWHDLRRKAKDRTEIKKWTESGRPSPPPEGVKHANLKRIAKTYSLSTLVETGTFYGETLFVMRRQFKEIYSIELSPDLYHLAMRRLGHFGNIRLYCGDSGQLLPEILDDLSGTTLFWLDGHYCAGPSAKGESDTPIKKELDVILSKPAGRNALVIDDARCFTEMDDYPSVDWIRAQIKKHRPAAEVVLECDAICAYPI